MDYTKITRIKMSLLQLDTEVNDESKAEYSSLLSGTFLIPQDFFIEGENHESTISDLVNQMYKDLTYNNHRYHADSLGIWITYKNIVFENAISISTLEDIRKYSVDNADPLLELLKMTIFDDDEHPD